MKYLFCLLPVLLFAGCHFADAVDEINRVDPATGKSVGQVIAEKTIKAVSDPYNIQAWIEIGTALAAVIGIGVVGKKNSTDHDKTQEVLAAVAAKVAPDVKTT